MAKRTTKAAPKAAPRVNIKGANKADQAQIDGARKANAAERDKPAETAPRTTTNTEKAADVNLTPRARRDALQRQFDKADEDGKAEMIEERRLTGAALGGGF